MEMRKMRDDEAPGAPLYGCWICGGISPGQVDTGKGDGAAGFFTVCLTCAATIGRCIGMIGAEEATSLQEHLAAKTAAFEQLERELESHREAAEVVEHVKRAAVGLRHFYDAAAELDDHAIATLERAYS